ncbi:MAG: rhomboid family intramembrane serine protease [Hyphomicrobiaceae bacterium]
MAIQTLIIANIAVFAVQPLLGDSLIYTFALWPVGEGFGPWQLISYAFLHGGLPHLFFNMFGLWMFGAEIERAWGSQRLVVYYAVCVIGAALTQLLASAMTGSNAPTIGASGGVFGILLAFAMRYPNRTIVLLFPPIPMPAWLFATLYGGLELVLGVTGTDAGVAHFAHLGGMLGGYLLIRTWGGGQHPRRRQ